MKSSLNRRQFLSSLAATAAGGMVLPRLSWAQGATAGTAPGASLVVVHGKDINKMVAAGIAKMGGWKAFVKVGKKAVLKPNVTFARLPEEGAATIPGLVGACVKECLAAGASEVVVPEHLGGGGSKEVFIRTGIGEAVEKAGGRLYSADKREFYQKVQIPKGVKLKETDIVKDLLECGCLINLPVAKHHSGAVLTIGMKNWMGSIWDRGFWHRNDLHQCIADFNTVLKANLVIIDATRVMTANGPGGPCPPEKMLHPDLLIFGTDPVAADAYATTLFGKKPFDVPHIKIAHEMGLGCGDLASVNVEQIEA